MMPWPHGTIEWSLQRLSEKIPCIATLHDVVRRRRRLGSAVNQAVRRVLLPIGYPHSVRGRLCFARSLLQRHLTTSYAISRRHLPSPCRTQPKITFF
jgi:uncharacterized protein (DUF2342 family)